MNIYLLMYVLLPNISSVQVCVVCVSGYGKRPVYLKEDLYI